MGEHRGLFGFHDLADAPYPVILGDARGSIVDANAAFCRLVDRSREEFVGRPWATLVHPDDHAASRAGFAEILRGGAIPPVVRRRVLRRDGQTLWMDLS